MLFDKLKDFADLDYSKQTVSFLSELDKFEGLVVLMDLSWHMYRSFFTFMSMSTPYKEHTGHYFGLIQTINSIKEAYPTCKIILCQDGYPRRRKSLYPDYKEGRDKSGYNVHNDTEELVNLLLLIPNVYLAYSPEEESDDIMHTLSKVCNFSYIYSGDDDLLQSISSKTKVVRKFDRGRFETIDQTYLNTDPRFITKYHRVTIQGLPLYRSIVGDKSDGIKGFDRFPRDLAVYVADKAIIPQALKEVTSLPSTFTKAKRERLSQLHTGFDKLLLNYRLIKLQEVFFEIISEPYIDYSDLIDKYNLFLIRRFA